MRRIAVVLLTLVLALGLVGCGGAEEPAETETPAAESAETPPAPAGEPAEPGPQRSSERIFEPMPTSDAVPADIVERLDSGRAMVLLFLSDDEDVSDDMRKEAERVSEDYSGSLDLMVYDLSEYVTMNASGRISLDEAGLDADQDGQEALKLASALEIDHVPYLLVVDNQGQRIFWTRGPIDAAVLGREVERAVR